MKTKLTVLIIFAISSCIGQSIDDRIKEIRKEYSIINNYQNLSTDSIDLLGESTESGYLKTFKDSKGKLRKIIAVFYSETGKGTEEFYIQNDKLIFVFIQRCDYNRPIYWDDKLAKENRDSVVFDYNKSKISENRYYFDDNEKLIQWIDKDKKIILEKQQLDEVNSGILKEFETFKSKKK
jgi:hypothetical protein